MTVRLMNRHGMFFAPICWCLGLMIASAQEMNTRELETLMNQQMAVLERFSADVTFTKTNSSRRISDAEMQKMISDRIRELRNSPEMQAGVRREAISRGIEIGPGLPGLEKWARDNLEATFQAESRRGDIKTRHSFVVAAVRQIESHEEGDNVKTKKILQYGLQHPKIPGSSPERWTCLEPSRLNGVVPMWSKNWITIRGMVPIGADHESVTLLHESGFKAFWDGKGKLKNLGLRSFNGETFQYICREHPSKSTWLLAAFGSPITSCIPEWIAEIAERNGAAKIDVKAVDSATATMHQIARGMLAGDTQDMPAGGDSVVMLSVTHFQKDLLIQGFGYYPSSARHIIPLYREKATGELAVSALHDFQLNVTSIKTGAEVIDPFELIIEDGVSYLDRDTGLSWIIGGPPPVSHQVVRPALRRWPWLLGLAIVFVSAYCVYRRRSNRD